MEFYSLVFIIFLAVSLLGYYTVFRRYQWVWLLIVSLAFYGYMARSGGIFIFATGCITWGAALLLERFQGKENLSKRRVILWATMLVVFGILAVVKYTHLLSSFTRGLLIPLGISFYIFQSVGYLIDAYNGKIQVEHSFAKYFLFIAFFPQLIQGPINRWDEMQNQFFKEHRLTEEKFQHAILRLLYGMLKKFAIADILYEIVDRCLGSVAGSVIIAGVFLYAIYQYADFSGGIDMVLAVAELFDIEMAENFRQPYFAKSLGEFWRRWHITLGHWMRDYVFYPFELTKPIKKLGKFAKKHFGKHVGKVLPVMLGNILVFFLVGLWHGSQWHFILWGLYNGLIIGFSDLLAPCFQKLNQMCHIKEESHFLAGWRMLRTFLIVVIGGYFDRIEDMAECFRSMYLSVANLYPAMLPIYWKQNISPDYPLVSVLTVVVACVIVLVTSIAKERQVNVADVIGRKPFAVRGIVYFAMVSIILISFLSTTVNVGFLYANF